MRTIQQQLAALGASPEMIAGSLCNGRPISECDDNPKRSDPYKSKWERLYALELGDLLRHNQIAQWGYEALTFTIAPGANGKRGARFTPDFVVWRFDGVMECHEVKGFMREAARVRFLTCRTLYPHIKWRMVRRTKTGWEDVL